MNLLPLYRATMPFFRRRRMRRVAAQLRLRPTTTVLDVGGLSHNWRWLDPPPRVTLLNLDSGEVVADGRRLPFRDDAFDVVFSNSVIEHVGSRSDQAAFAAEIRRVGRSYAVQTPNRWFPLEPHLLTPFVQFLPRRLRLRLIPRCTIWGLLTRPTAADVERAATIELLDAGSFIAMFPEATLHRERFLALTKSLLAVRNNGYRDHP